MTQEHEIRLEVTLNGEAAHKLLLEADRRGVKPKTRGGPSGGEAPFLSPIST
jgi:hypothetical protein